MDKKPIHAKPSFYAIMFEPLKAIALKYGYNLVLHGSLNRDMDLIAIPWVEEVGVVDEMINEFCEFVGGEINEDCTKVTHHGRKFYVIDIYRGGYKQGSGFSRLTYTADPQTYIDISVIPTSKSNMAKCMSCEKEVEYNSGIFTCNECSK